MCARLYEIPDTICRHRVLRPGSDNIRQIHPAKYIPLNTDVSAQQENNPKDGKDNQPKVRQDNQPKAKFRKVESAVPGEYLVHLTDDVKIEDIEQVADELIAKYGGSIGIDNEIVKETKQADGSIKREVVRPGKRAIYKKNSRKGFYGLMTEEQAKSLSEDPRVDYVTEAGVSKIGGTSIPGGILYPDTNKPVAKPDDNLKLEPNSPAIDQDSVI